MNTSSESHDQDGRLANRAALLTLLSVCCFLLALLAMPMTFQATDRLAPRAAASAPLAVGVGTAIAARQARAQLGAHREVRAAAAAEARRRSEG